MKKNNLVRTIIVIFFLFLLVALYYSITSEKAPEIKNDRKDFQEQDASALRLEIFKKNEARLAAENFAVAYYSYAWGDFSNIESQYSAMTEEMKNAEQKRVEEIKEKIESQPLKRITEMASLAENKFVSYEEEKAISEIKLNIVKIPLIYNKENDEWSDGENIYTKEHIEKHSKKIIENLPQKTVRINLVKQKGLWKISGIE